MSKHWIDDADHWICPICGFETSSPAKYQGCKCPKCGFQDDKDRAESEVDNGNYFQNDIYVFNRDGFGVLRRNKKEVSIEDGKNN